MSGLKPLLVFVCTLAVIPSVSGQALFQSIGEQCVGTYYDPDRLEVLTKESVESLVSGSFARDGQEFGFITRQVSEVVSAGESLCIAERHRIRETVQSIPIFGADFVVTVGSCTGVDRAVAAQTNTLASMPLASIRSVDGYIVSSVSIPTGFDAKRTKDEARKMVAALYQVTEEKVTTINLEVYPTQEQDHRAWIATVLVDTVPGEPQLYQVVVDDDTEKVILQCEIAGLREKTERATLLRRRMQEAGDSGEPLDTALCSSCATLPPGIQWDNDENVECPASTLYMNNEDRNTFCVRGIGADNKTYLGPGPVPSLHWGGTLDCGSSTVCHLSPLPECQDAIHDIQWGTVNFLRYMQDNFGMMGGLVKDANHPKPVIGRAHFDFRFCNAFYVPGDFTVTFGDCDCELFTPLVSTDVVVHEIVHGMTSESSGLIYFLQSGGLNEAYSDIMACAMEFTVNDDLDTPDFTVGESIGKTFLRHMEFPSQDGNSIDTFCDYEHGMSVHYSSGYLNKAYVNAVRDCESRCGTTSECAILIAHTFMYTNLETLSMATNFRQAAEQTCRNVDDYFAAHAPSTSCTIEETRIAVTNGFKAVGVSMSLETCRATITCERKGILEQTTDAFRNAFKLVKLLCQSMREQLSFF